MSVDEEYEDICNTPDEFAYSEVEEAEADALLDAWNAPDHPRFRYSGIYFVQCGPYIKIGVGRDVRSRVQALQCASPFDIEPIGWIRHRRLKRKAELDLHTKFAAHRHKGEWFHNVPELRHYILFHAEPWPEGA
jgi:hypothetical protein